MSEQKKPEQKITFRFKEEPIYNLVKQLSESTYHSPHSFCRMAVIEYLKMKYPDEYSELLKNTK